MLQTILLVVYSMPYIFLATVIDFYRGSILGYILALAILTGCCNQALKFHSMFLVVIGNIVSFLSSYYFMMQNHSERWGAFFKPWTQGGSTIFWTAIVIGVQLMTIYLWHVKQKTQKKD